MKKKKKKNGMVIEIKRGKELIVVDDICIGVDGGGIYMSEFRDDLTHNLLEALDVMKVYAPIISVTFSDRELLWKRPWTPEIDDTYYMIDLQKRDLYRCEEWEDDLFDNEWYDKGLIFETKEEAIEIAQKMLQLAKEDKQ